MLARTFEVTVRHPTANGTDRLGNPVAGEPWEEVVPDVLVQSPTTSDLEAARPAGRTIAYVLHMPVTYQGSMRGCTVDLPAPFQGTYRVVGDPRPDPNAPTRFANRWNRAARVELADG